MGNALVRFVYFAALAVINWIIFRQFWIAAIKSTGVSKKSLYAYADKTNPNVDKKREEYIRRLLIKHSRTPKRTKRMLTVYTWGTFPTIMCVAFGILGFAPSLNSFFKYSTIAFPIIILAAAVLGYFYAFGKKKTEADRLDKKKTEENEDFKSLKELIKESKEEVLPDRAMALKRKRIIKIAVPIVAVLIIVGIFVSLFNVPNSPMSASEIQVELIQQQIISYDRTEKDQKDRIAKGQEPYDYLLRHLIIQKADVNIEIYNFTDDYYAKAMFDRHVNAIKTLSTTNPKTSKRTGYGYARFTAQDDKNYLVVIRIKDAFAYGVCSLEHKDALIQILKDIRYM